MRVVRSASGLKLGEAEHTAVTIGKFDGLHPGHRELIRQTVSAAEMCRKQGSSALAVVFAIDLSPTGILSDHERRKMLRDMGVDILIMCPLTPAFVRTEAEDFIRDTLVRDLHARWVVTGSDFRFGYGRTGDDAMLEAFGKEYGFTSRVVPDVIIEGKKVSSSRIREAVSAGDMELTGKLLGYPYFVTGEIIHGRQLGRTIGVPTANLIPHRSKLLPPNGVYFSEAEISGRICHGITNVGTKPTVDGHFVGVETYFFDCSADLYGKKMKVNLLHFERPEVRFGSVDELKEQIRRDEEKAAEYFRNS